MTTNPNYTEDADGYSKNEHSVQRGNADYFSKSIPPTTDGAGRPIKDGKTDWAEVIRRANENAQ